MNSGRKSRRAKFPSAPTQSKNGKVVTGGQWEMRWETLEQSYTATGKLAWQLQLIIYTTSLLLVLPGTISIRVLLQPATPGKA